MTEAFYYWIAFLGVFGAASLALLQTRHWMMTVRLMALTECLMISLFLSSNGFLSALVPYTIPVCTKCGMMEQANWMIQYVLPAWIVLWGYIGITSQFYDLGVAHEGSIVVMAVLVIGIVFIVTLFGLLCAHFNQNIPVQCRPPLEPVLFPAIILVFGVCFCMEQEKKQDQDRSDQLTSTGNLQSPG